MNQPINAIDPASKIAYTFIEIGALHNAIKDYGFIPIRSDGTPMTVVYLKEYDGYILDGAPINVWMTGEWLEGQQEALMPFWNSGQIQKPTGHALTAPVVPMPPEVKAQTEAYQKGQTGLFGMDQGTLLTLGAGLAAIWWISRR